MFDIGQNEADIDACMCGLHWEPDTSQIWPLLGPRLPGFGEFIRELCSATSKVIIIVHLFGPQPLLSMTTSCKPFDEIKITGISSMLLFPYA